jgi:putative DNA-invertase from lambdoid prophage Rac
MFGVGGRLIGMPTALYLRVSTSEQTTANQRPDLDHLLASRGLTADIVYEEKASAAKFRPEFERMLGDARAGKFDTLAIWSIDRFGRSLSGNLNDFVALEKLGVRILSAREPWIDTQGPVKELLIAIFSWVAQQERERLIERTRAGIATSRARGVTWGRPCPTLLPKHTHHEVFTQWVAEGRPDGFWGLAHLLGLKSASAAWGKFKAWERGLKKIEDSPRGAPEGRAPAPVNTAA